MPVPIKYSSKYVNHKNSFAHHIVGDGVGDEASSDAPNANTQSKATTRKR